MHCNLALFAEQGYIVWQQTLQEARATGMTSLMPYKAHGLESRTQTWKEALIISASPSSTSIPSVRWHLASVAEATWSTGCKVTTQVQSIDRR